MKTVLFMPGSGEDLHSRDYSSVIKAIESKGYAVRFLSITWSRTTIDDWTQELDKQYKKFKSEQVVLAGFSFGALTAFVSAVERNPSELWLFSLPSYFAEDLESKNQKKTWVNQLGLRRIDAFRKLNFKKLSQSIECKTLIFYGQIELDKWTIMKERALAAHNLIQNNQYYPIPGVGHDVANKNYIEAIRRAI